MGIQVQSSRVVQQSCCMLATIFESTACTIAKVVTGQVATILSVMCELEARLKRLLCGYPNGALHHGLNGWSAWFIHTIYKLQTLCLIHQALAIFPPFCVLYVHIIDETHPSI